MNDSLRGTVIRDDAGDVSADVIIDPAKDVLATLDIGADQEEERSRLTREALADVDAARVIDHQAVQAWADGLSSAPPLPVQH